MASVNGTNGNSKKRSADMMNFGFSESDMKGTIKLRSSNARKKPRTNPGGGWKERAEMVERSDEKVFKEQAQQQSQGISPPSPVVTQLDERDVQLLVATGRPSYNDELDTVICKHCKKPVIKNVATAHVKACLKLKSEKQKERKKAKEAAAAAAAGKGGEGSADGISVSKEVKNEESGGGGKGTAGGGEEGVKMKKGAKKMAKKTMDADAAPKKKTKKEKAAEEEGKEPKQQKQKKKKEKPAKPEPKPKAPVDVEKQCGVPLPNGALCARSLTCKSHSMGAKRAVQGRSQRYDVLLAAYQRKNQAKQQKAAIQASAPHPEDGEGNNLPVDSDEETELVMAGIARANPRPFVQSIMIPARQRYQYQRMKMCSQGVFKPPKGSLIFGARNAGGGDAMHMLSNVNGALGDVSGIINDVQMGNHGPFGTELDANSGGVPIIAMGSQFQTGSMIGGPAQQGHRTQPMVLG